MLGNVVCGMCCWIVVTITGIDGTALGTLPPHVRNKLTPDT
jgi:hypothetical protein